MIQNLITTITTTNEQPFLRYGYSQQAQNLHHQDHLLQGIGKKMHHGNSSIISVLGIKA